MKRRRTLQILAGSAAGLTALGLWARRWPVFRPKAPVGFYAEGEEQLVHAIADTILPTRDNIGATGVGADQFVARYIEHCSEPAEQELVKTRLAALEARARERHGQAFTACTPDQRRELLLAFGSSGDPAEAEFFNLMKNLTIRGFNTSEEVMVNYYGYAVMPGHYHGCVDTAVPA